jgi:hypothetical protein
VSKRSIFAPPLVRPRVPPGGPSTAARIHLAFNRIVKNRARSSRGGALALAARVVVWYPVALLATCRALFRWGASVRERTGKGFLRQAWELLGLALGHRIQPKAYYCFRLYEDANRSRADEYLHRFETKPYGIYKHFKHLRHVTAGGQRSLGNKDRFYRTCSKHGIATAPVFVKIEQGQVEPFAYDGPALPPTDLIVKPCKGHGGSGVSRWEWDADEGCFRSFDGERLQADALLERLRLRSKGGALIVQPRLLNHPAVADLSAGALTTARVMSCLNEAGDYEPVIAVFRMAVDDLVVDNIHAGGIASPVGIASGKLGAATALDPRSGWYREHPRTGAPIAGRELPCWPQVLDLVVRAHRVFTGYVVIGWDVAITAEGPCLVEGNSGACVNLIQRPHDAPLGSSRFGELLDYHLARSFA